MIQKAHGLSDATGGKQIRHLRLYSILISQLHSIIVTLSSYLRWFKQPGQSSMHSYILQEKCMCRADASTEAIP